MYVKYTYRKKILNIIIIGGNYYQESKKPDKREGSRAEGSVQKLEVSSFFET